MNEERENESTQAALIIVYFCWQFVYPGLFSYTISGGVADNPSIVRRPYLIMS